MINLIMQGGLGNQLFQYVSARILAENSKSFLYSNPIQGFRNIKTLHLGRVFLGKKQVIGGHHLPEKVYMRTELNGYFQRIEKLEKHKTKVLKWLTPNSIDLKVAPNAGDLTLSIRRASNGWLIEQCPSIDFYLNLLKKIRFKKLWITTDSPSDEYFKPIISEYPGSEFVHLGPLGQYEFIRKSYSIIVAPSTFSVLASWSSQAKIIYWPKIAALDFSKTEHNWFPSNDVRHVYVGGE
jgi:hypothetical protein